MSINDPLREPNDPVRANGEPVQSERFDRAVSVALHDLPVPAGLADRLIAAMAKEPAPALSLPKHRFIARRQVLLAAGSLALTALVALSLSLFWQPERVVAQQDLGVEVAGWLNKLPRKGWRPATAALPKGVALDPVVAGQLVQWQTFHHAGTSGWSASVTAIDVAPAGRPRAVVFVVHSHAATRFVVPSAPTPTTRLALSRGFMATAWQPSPRLLYVLVVEEDRGQRLEEYLRKRPQA